MQYKNFGHALSLSSRIENIKAKIEALQEAIRQPNYYHLKLQSCEPVVESIDFFSNGEDPYIREVAARYAIGLEDELKKLIAEFEALE